MLVGWRESTIDVDMKVLPESDAVLRAIPRLKEELELNIELASPDDFIPVAPGWEDHSPFIERHGRLSFHHFEMAAQALAKIERGHRQDATDVKEMLARGLVTRDELLRYLGRVEPQLYRYPALDPVSFRSSVESVVSA
ncbi:MAG: DUF6036 family nucleotidyltransferase [Acidimicrobiales bacterium]